MRRLPLLLILLAAACRKAPAPGAGEGEAPVVPTPDQARTSAVPVSTAPVPSAFEGVSSTSPEHPGPDWRPSQPVVSTHVFLAPVAGPALPREAQVAPAVSRPRKHAPARLAPATTAVPALGAPTPGCGTKTVQPLFGPKAEEDPDSCGPK